MKKLMKKLAALALAGAMVLSLGVSALATEPTNYTSGDITGAGKNETTALKHPILLTVPTAGDGAFDMVIDPHGLIKSTNAKRFGDTFTFDYGGGKSYSSLTDEDGEPLPSNNLFFKNSATSYGPVSALQTIINKSDMDVGVKLSLEVTKGANDGKLIFAKSVDEVKAVEGVPAIYLAVGSGDDTVAPVTMQGTPSLKLDSKTTTGEADVITAVAWAPEAYTPEVGEETEMPDPTDDAYKDSEGVFDEDTYNDAVASYEGYLANVAAQEKLVADFVDAAAGITFTASSINDGSNVDNTITVADFDGYNIEASETVGIYAVTKTVPAPTADDEDATTDLAIGAITLTVADAAANKENTTVAVVKGAYFASKDESTVPNNNTLLTGINFVFDAELDLAGQKEFADAGAKDGVDVKAKYTESNTTYTITKPTVSGYTFTDPASVGVGENVYEVTKGSDTVGTLTVTLADTSPTADINEQTGTLKVTCDESKTATSEIKGVVADAGLYIDDYKSDAETGKSKYVRVLGQVTKSDGNKGPATDDDFNKAVFYVTGNINEDAAWDNNLTANDTDQTANAVGANLSLKLVWDINKIGDDYTDKLSEDAPSAAGNTKPTVAVKSKATKGTAATKATLTVSMGSGTLKAESVEFKVNTTTLTYNATSGELTIPKAQANTATGWKAIFTYPLADGQETATTYEVTFDPFTAS